MNIFFRQFNSAALLILLGFQFQVRGNQITAEGQASGDYRTAREQALADALREAVRIGVGVDLLGESKVQDFALDYYRVLCSAFGHVKNYSILESKLGADGVYRVKVQADVEKGVPATEDKMALQNLIRAKGAPRLGFAVGGTEEGFAASVLEEIASDLQIPVVRPYPGNGSPAADYLVEGQLDARLERTETIGVNPTAKVFSISCELKAIDPATRSMVAVGVFGTDRVHKSTLPSEQSAVRDAVKKLLSAPSPGGGMRFFEKLLARWVADTDLGTVKRLEFTGITADEYGKIHAALIDTEKVGAVWPREFNWSGTSVIDVETRLDNSALAEEVSKSAARPISVARTAQNQIAFELQNSSVSQ